MVRVKFRYRDEMSNREWREQECTVSSVRQAKKLYGLDEDPTIIECEIIEAEKVK